MDREHVSAKKLAEIAGVVPSAVSKWKNGGSIGTDKIKRIADHFGVTIDDLVDPIMKNIGVELSELISKSHKQGQPIPSGSSFLFICQRIAESCKDDPQTVGRLATLMSMISTIISGDGGDFEKETVLRLVDKLLEKHKNIQPRGAQ